MKLKFIFSTLLFCSATQVFAQDGKTPFGLGAKTNIESLESTGIGRAYDNRYEGSKGSPFLHEEFAKAKISLVSNVILEEIPVKYNVYDNTIVYKDSRGTILAIDAAQVNQLTLSDPKTGANIKMGKFTGLESVNPKAAVKLFIFLHEGERTKFAVLPAKELIKADYKGSSYSAGRAYDEFFDKKDYYFSSNNSNPDKVKLNKKNLLKALADKEAEIKSYISKEKIDASTEEGWVKVLSYYETL